MRNAIPYLLRAHLEIARGVEAAGFNQTVAWTLASALLTTAQFFSECLQCENQCVLGKMSPRAAVSRCLRGSGRIRSWNRLP